MIELVYVIDSIISFFIYFKINKYNGCNTIKMLLTISTTKKYQNPVQENSKKSILKAGPGI